MLPIHHSLPFTDFQNVFLILFAEIRIVFREFSRPSFTQYFRRYRYSSPLHHIMPCENVAKISALLRMFQPARRSCKVQGTTSTWQPHGHPLSVEWRHRASFPRDPMPEKIGLLHRQQSEDRNQAALCPPFHGPKCSLGLRFFQCGKLKRRPEMALSSPKLTPERAAKIKALLQGTPMNHAQIAAHLGGMNQGRISEVKTGKRFAEIQPCSLRKALGKK